MALVRPEVAVLELCKDRVGLLLPQKRGPQLWHAREVRLLGLPPTATAATTKAKEGGEEEGKASPPPPPFPFTPDELLRACRCAPGAPVSTADIEQDCVALQSTGLFRAVRPSTSLPPAGAAPQFVRGLVDALRNRRRGAAMTGEGVKASSPPSSETRMQPVLPLGEIRFKATPRQLPPLASVSWRLSSALEAVEVVSVDKRRADTACAACLADAEARAASGSSSSASGATAAALAAAAPLFRAAVKGCDPQDVSVQYEGVGGPSVEAVLRPGPPSGIRGAPETGLESYAEEGRGVGVEPFVPYRGPLALTKTMRVENLADVLELELESIDDVSPVGGIGGTGSTGSSSSSSSGGGNFVSRWPKLEAKKKMAEEKKEKNENDDDAAAADDDEEEEKGSDPKSFFDPLIEATATWLTKEYGRHQSAAAAAAGVADGDGWRRALDAAAAASPPPSTSSSPSSASSPPGLAAVQVLLGDAPASRTSKEIAAGVLKALPLALGAAVASVAGAVAVLSGKVDVSSSSLPLDISTPEAQAAAVAAAAAASLAAFWPLVGPLIQIERFSKLSAEQIEKDVAPREPLSVTSATRFGGEDALVSWPGARRAVVEERDSFMAASIFAAARGESFVPAFVLDKDGDGRGVWRYAMPQGEGDDLTPASTSSSAAASAAAKFSSRVLPKRGGEGVYAPVPAPRAVVAVVGTAHAAGIRRAWARLVEEEGKKGAGGKDARAVAAAALEGETLV